MLLVSLSVLFRRLSMKNKIEDLCNYFFVIIEGLLDEEKFLDIECVKVVVYVSLVIIEFVKVEVKVLEIIGVLGSSGSIFL